MGLSSKPQVTTVDPTPQFVQPLQRQASNFLQQLFTSPADANPFANMTSPLQRQATGGIQQFLSQPSPEQRTLNQVQPALLGMVNASTLQNPFGSVGGFDQSRALVNAMQQPFQQNLRAAQGQLASAAPGRFSTAFTNQGIGLAQRALSDFNVAQQQAMQQGLNLDLAARQQANAFTLGAEQLRQSGALGAAGLLGQLSQAANPLSGLLQAGQLGLAQTQAMVNPTLQLLLGGLGFAQPMPQQVIAQQSGGGLGSILGSLAGMAAGSIIPGAGNVVGSKLGSWLGGKLFGGS